MYTRTTAIASLFVLGLGLSAGIGVALAATASHEGHQVGEMALTLNAGVKWQGDDNMIKGMEGIRGAIVPRLAAIHDQTLPAEDYKVMAAEIQAQVDFLVANCKLAPEVDEQLHMVLEQVLNGISEIQNGPDQRSGAVRIVMALKAYGDHFEHPNWQPLE